MNICLAIVSHTWAGAETVVYELAKHLRDRGENVFILLNQECYKIYEDLSNIKLLNIGPSFHAADLIDACITKKVSTEDKEGLLNTFHGSFYLNSFLREMYYKRIRSSLAQIILQNSIDIIHSHLNAGITLVSSLHDELGIPIVATLHGQSEAGMRRKSYLGWLTSPIGSWRRERFSKALSKYDKVTAVSEAELTAVESCDIPIKDKSIVIPNGINIGEVRSGLSTTKLKGEFNLLFPGGIRLVKGGDIIIESLSDIRRVLGSVHLYFAGEVPNNHALRKMTSAAGLDEHVTFTGLLDVREYRRLLNSIDLLVLPSREESFGIAFLEAMALGKPIIAGNVGGVPEVVKNGRNGILVEPNAVKVAEAILYLYENENVRREMSQKNQFDASRFDWCNIIPQYMYLYKSLIKH